MCRDIIVKAADKGGALVVWLFGGPSSTKKKLCGNFLVPSVLHAKLKSIKVSFSLTDKLCNSTINDLIVKQELPAIATNLTNI